MATNYNYNWDQSLSTTQISANLRDWEAARSGFFTLVVDDIDNIVRASFKGDPESASGADKIANAQEYLKLNVIQTSVPRFTLASHEYRRGNDVVKFAGVPSFEAGSMIVDDVIGLDSKSILYGWQNLAYNVHTRKGGRMINYKKEATLYEYTQDYELVRSWHIHGCWISDIQEDNFNKEQDGPRKLTATLQYDRAEMEMPT